MTEPYGPDSNILPPPRGLLSVIPVLYEGSPAIEVECDCGASALVRFDCDHPHEHLDGTEIPFTCPGCTSVTWLTLRFQVISDGS